MAELKICRICLKTEVKMYSLEQFYLKTYYEEIMTQKVNLKENIPKYFCYMCASLLYKFHKFKEKCYYGHKVLLEMTWKSPINYDRVNKLYHTDKHLKPLLDILQHSKNVKTCNVKDKPNVDIEFIANNSQDSDDQPLKPVTKVEIDDTTEMADEIWNNDESGLINDDDNDYIQKDSPINLFVDENEEAVNIQAIEINDLIAEKTKHKKFQKQRTPKTFDTTKWKKYILSNEEALKQFQKRAEQKYYKTAAFKCVDCLKGFSTENMFKRHQKIRHDKSIGSIECSFCKMRFRLACDLRKHMRSHYVRYECLQCKVTMIECSAILHDEYHSGVTKKCEYCGEEFRHQSTYYTHLRTHRSAYVCNLCGSSFVSELGLNNHKRVKHVLNDIESPDDDEPVDTYCSRCDVTFETRKAYSEHLFNSVMHADHGMEDDQKFKVSKKIVGKRLKKEICKELRINDAGITNAMIEQFQSKRRKIRRASKKATTCHQCGKHFSTQAACMKHHTREHPGTSFFASGERHVCEICGASLAPGSVAMHENIHSRKKVYPCEVCGKEFHSNIGLKRHSVTHTGEKPFACTMCDKRFTQSNSMKLHFKTFHLKQPYPKRNRRKKKDEIIDIPDIREETSKASSEHSNEQELRRNAPNVIIQRIQDDNMHYLTLN